MAYVNRADPEYDQGLHCLHFHCLLRSNCIKSKPEAKKVRNKLFEILGHLPYIQNNSSFYCLQAVHLLLRNASFPKFPEL